MEHDPLGHSHDALLGLIEGRELRQNGVVGVGHLDDDGVFLMYGTALWQGMVSGLDDWKLRSLLGLFRITVCSMASSLGNQSKSAVVARLNNIKQARRETKVSG